MAVSVTQSYIDADCYYEKVSKQNQAYFTNCNPVYLFTNDNPKDIFSNMNLEGKLISVTASFDHQLNAILMGAKDITSFDLNSIAKYFAELKLQAVKHLSYEEFLEFYKIRKRLGKILKCDVIFNNFDKNAVYKLCDDMDYSLAYFFERLMKLGFFDKEDSTGYFAYISKPNVNMYLDKEKFYELKEKLQDVTFREYIDCDIFNLKQYLNDEQYSAMIFSNISSYMKGEELDKFYNFLKSLDLNLTAEGKIQIGTGLISNPFNITGGDPIDSDFVLKYKDNIYEVKTKKEIITYYHK